MFCPFQKTFRMDSFCISTAITVSIVNRDRLQAYPTLSNKWDRLYCERCVGWGRVHNKKLYNFEVK